MLNIDKRSVLHMGHILISITTLQPFNRTKMNYREIYQLEFFACLFFAILDEIPFAFSCSPRRKSYVLRKGLSTTETTFP